MWYLLVNWVRVESQWTLRGRSIKKFLLNLIKIEDLGDFKQQVRLSDFCFVLKAFLLALQKMNLKKKVL